MNDYGLRVMEHWKTWLPTRYQQIEDPISYFTQVGKQIEDQVLQMVAAGEADQSSVLDQMDYLARVGRLNAIQMSAEEIALSEFLLEPEPQTVESPAGQDSEDPFPFMDQDGMPVDQSHPLWQMADDESVSLADFRQAAATWFEQEKQKMASNAK